MRSFSSDSRAFHPKFDMATMVAPALQNQNAAFADGLGIADGWNAYRDLQARATEEKLSKLRGLLSKLDGKRGKALVKARIRGEIDQLQWKLDSLEAERKYKLKGPDSYQMSEAYGRDYPKMQKILQLIEKLNTIQKEMGENDPKE